MLCLQWLTSKSLFIFLGIYVFQSLCILLNAALCREYPLKPLFLQTLLWYMYSFALKLKALSLCSLTPYIPRSLSCFLSPRHLFFFILCYPLHLTNTHLFPSFLSGAFVDRVQLPDDDGTSAERKPQRDGGRPLHATWLSAKMEGQYISVCISVCFK